MTDFWVTESGPQSFKVGRGSGDWVFHSHHSRVEKTVSREVISLAWGHTDYLVNCIAGIATRLLDAMFRAPSLYQWLSERLVVFRLAARVSPGHSFSLLNQKLCRWKVSNWCFKKPSADTHVLASLRSAVLFRISPIKWTAQMIGWWIDIAMSSVLLTDRQEHLLPGA